MRRTHRVALLASLPVIAVAAPATTNAFHFHAVKWPEGVVRYYNAAPDQAWAVNQAVRAWNTSGAHIRFVAVPPAEAQMTIEEQQSKVYCTEGLASLGYARGAHVLIFPAHGITHACNPYWAARVMTHELGHVLGLQHEDRACAAMNAVGNLHGGKECAPGPVWDWRCRLLEPDDIAGAVAAYGGTARRATLPELCPLYRAINRPAALAARYDQASGVIVLTFKRPAEPAVPAFLIPSPWRGRPTYTVAGPLRSCSSADTATATRWAWHAKPGGTETFTTPATPGTWCYAVWALDTLGRPSPLPAKVVRTVPRA